MITMKDLQQLGHEVHFCAVGALKARIFEELEPVLLKRAAENRLTAFEEPNLQRRMNPFLLMPEVKSLITVATSYHTTAKMSDQAAPRFNGELARFARGLDYHRILHRQLHEMAEKLQLRVPDLKWQAYVDTGPLVDRHLAFQSGMGFYGKNNCLILPEFGSCVVLGYLLINQPVEGCMEEQQPLKSCEGCGRCQRACPVKALEEPYQIDPDRCLSHLLQRKENIPEMFRKSAGNKLYGCDICQDVCPHNLQAAVTREPAMETDGGARWLDLAHLLKLSNRMFNRLYRSRAFGWRGQRIMQRNALLALGNTRDVEAVELAIPFLEHPRAELREMACWAVKQHQSRKEQ